MHLLRIPPLLPSSLPPHSLIASGESWFSMIKGIYEEKIAGLKLSNTKIRKPLSDLKATWNGNSFAKGELGVIRDFATLSYPSGSHFHSF